MRKIFVGLIVFVVFSMSVSLIWNTIDTSGVQTSFRDYNRYAQQSRNVQKEIIKLIMDNPNYKVVEVRLDLLKPVRLNGRETNAQLVSYASLYNKESGFSNTPDLYYHVPTQDRHDTTIRNFILYFLVSPEAANKNLRFKYEYPGRGVLADKACYL